MYININVNLYLYVAKKRYFSREIQKICWVHLVASWICVVIQKRACPCNQWYERIVIGGVIGNIIGTLLSIMLVRCFQAGIRERYIQFSVINLLISNHRDNGRRIYYFNIATFIIFLIDMFCINVDILWQMARYIRYIFFDGYDFFNMKWK